MHVDLMLPHIALLGKHSVALLTFEWVIIGVSLQVILEVAWSLEELPTVGVGALQQH